MITPTPDQDRVLCEIETWLRDPHGAQWKYLAGFAGTGKSSLAQFVAQDYKVLFCTFTGKAAQVLRSKGCPSASTLHKTIYRPSEKAVTGADGAIQYSSEFVPRDDGPLTGIQLVVLDECSQISAAMATDLLSHGVRVLVLGDPFQLPPISGEGYFTSRTPDYFLTEVHRQAKESGILRLATDIREGRGVGSPASYAPDATVCSLDEASDDDAEIQLLQFADVVLVGTHRFRHHFNKRYREVRGYKKTLAEAGDQLVCLANDHRKGLLNGGLWECESDARPTGHRKHEMLVRSLDSDVRLLAECWDHDFTGDESELLKMPYQKRAQHARFTFGYALTVHKSQGSEYDHVVVVDESSTFREHAPNWLYTAVTRASKRLVLVQR